MQVQKECKDELFLSRKVGRPVIVSLGTFNLLHSCEATTTLQANQEALSKSSMHKK